MFFTPKSMILRGLLSSKATQRELIEFSSFVNLVNSKYFPSFDKENILPSRSPVETTSLRLEVTSSITHELPEDRKAILPGIFTEANDDLLPIITISGT